jgi:hypothetical protein
MKEHGEKSTPGGEGGKMKDERSKMKVNGEL